MRRLIDPDPAGRFPCAADAASALQALDWGGDDEGPPPIGRNWRPRHPPTTVRPNGTGLALFLLRPWPLVGRERGPGQPLEHPAPGRVHHARPVVVLSGPQGVGRSRVASWLAERAVETGAAWALRARARLGERLDQYRHHTLSRATRALLRVEDLSPAESRARLAKVLGERGSLEPAGEAADLTAVLFPDSPRVAGRPIDRQKVWIGLFDRLPTIVPWCW